MLDPPRCGCDTIEQAETWTVIAGLIFAAVVILLLEIGCGGAG